MNSKSEKWLKIINHGKNEVIDFEKLSQEPQNIFVLLTMRGRIGKTMNMQIFMRDKYLENREKSIWCLNTKAQWDTALPRFLANVRLHYPKKWEDVEISEIGCYDKKTKEIFIYFVSLSSAHRQKTGRDDSILYCCLDEFNEGLLQIRKKQVALFESVFYTFTSPFKRSKMKTFIFGNQKSITSSLLLPTLGIEAITSEISYHLDGSVLFWVPQLKKEEVKGLNDYWLYKFSYKVGLGDESILNKNIKDNYEGVVKEMSQRHIILNTWTKSDCLKVDNFFFQTYIKNSQTYFHKLPQKPNDIQIYCAQWCDVEINIIHNQDLRNVLAQDVMNKDIFFDSFFTKNLIFGLF